MLNEADATHAREIAEQEVRRFAGLLQAALEFSVRRATNQDDAVAAIDEAIERYERGEFPS